jgi:hypothetical protein
MLGRFDESAAALREILCGRLPAADRLYHAHIRVIKPENPLLGRPW